MLQCRIGLISEVIVIGIVNPMSLFPSLFSQSYPLIFFQKVFVLVSITFLLFKYRQAPLALSSLSIIIISIIISIIIIIIIIIL